MIDEHYARLAIDALTEAHKNLVDARRHALKAINQNPKEPTFLRWYDGALSRLINSTRKRIDEMLDCIKFEKV